MYAKTKNSSVPSDAQARDKLAVYVYEYLLHVGAQKAAQTFLTEITWEKNITLGEPPGFLHTWWCVFWDLYCAAPERRDSCEHSSEAKAFHDYSAGLRPPPPSQMMPGQPPFMGGVRYPGPGPSGPRPNVRMPQGMGNDFSGPPGQPMMPNSMDPTRQGAPPGMVGPMNHRMNAPHGPNMSGGPMGPGSYGGAGMRGPAPNNNMGPGGPGVPPGMQMGGCGRPQMPPNTSSPMNYPLTSPGNYGGPSGPNGQPGTPLTPIMPSPQDSSNSGGNNIYQSMMKPGGNMGGEFQMGCGPDGNPMGPMGPNSMGGPVLEGLEGMKNSPGNGDPGTPREDSNNGMADFNLGDFTGSGADNLWK